MKKDIDFLKAYRLQNAKNIKGSRIKIGKMYVVIGALLVAVLVGGTGVGFTYGRITKGQADALRAETETSEMALRYNEIQRLKPSLTSITEYNDSVQKAEEVIKTIPRISLEEYNFFKTNLSSGMEIGSFTYNQGRINVVITTREAASIPAYIKKLKSANRYIDLEYNGYSGNAFESSYIYSFQIDATMKKEGVE